MVRGGGAPEVTWGGGGRATLSGERATYARAINALPPSQVPCLQRRCYEQQLAVQRQMPALLPRWALLILLCVTGVGDLFALA